MKFEIVKTDITVIGGGLAGVSAAVAAARLGRSVALVQNRPVLGGNSSSEVRVWVSGATATGMHRYARETGIIGEMLVENQYRNPDGNPYYWDLVVLETVIAETNIRLFLNTDVHEVEAEGTEESRTIRSVTGWMMGSERKIRFESSMYMDCTGDGLVGFLAGAQYRLGREARSEFGEPWAPESADAITLGSTLLFYTKDVGYPVKYVPPAFAKDIAKTSIPMRRVIRSGDSGCFYWWIEWGGELDTIHENERIRDELWSVIYGIWDYIKNSGNYEAEQLTLEWVGAIPGKREYRRFVGDYMLHQQDIINQTQFFDRVAFGGWSIDLHPPQGMYALEDGSKHLFSDGIYHIPFRSLYSINVDNMLMAGRNISATHVAFGTTRVMATCAVMGEAAGTGAALCVQKGITPRELCRDHLDELQQTLLRQDAAIIGIVNRDPNDLALGAVVTASGSLRRIAIEQPHELHHLHEDVGLLFPVAPQLEGLELLADVAAETLLDIELWDTGRAENYVPHSLIAACSIQVRPGKRQWIAADLSWRPQEDQNAFVIVKANPHVALLLSRQPLFGVLSFVRQSEPVVAELSDGQYVAQPVRDWLMRPVVRKPFCFRVTGETTAYSADKAIDGYNRPYGAPHLWLSDPLATSEEGADRCMAADGEACTNGTEIAEAGNGVVGREAWLQLSWNRPIHLSEVHLTWNDDVNEYLINLHFMRTPFDIFPELAADYRLETYVDGHWITVHRETANRKRKRIHHFSPVVADRLRVVIERTNGSPHAALAEIRVYEQERSRQSR